MDVVMVEEWIGLHVRIIGSPNPNNIGVDGEIVDETLNTITILTEDDKRKTIPKKGGRAQVLGSKKYLELAHAVFRPEDRTKKLYKKVVS